MLAYQVNDMTCGHCARAITKAVLALDGNAKVDVDLGQRMVRVESSTAADEALRQAIRTAGYEAVSIKPRGGGHEALRSSGCCCGTGASRCGG